MPFTAQMTHFAMSDAITTELPLERVSLVPFDDDMTNVLAELNTTPGPMAIIAIEPVSMIVFVPKASTIMRSAPGHAAGFGNEPVKPNDAETRKKPEDGMETFPVAARACATMTFAPVAHVPPMDMLFEPSSTKPLLSSVAM